VPVKGKEKRKGLGRKGALKWAQSDPLCHEILARMTVKPSSGVEIAKELGEDREHVAYRIRKMAGVYGDSPLIELVSTAQTNDRRRNLYRAVVRGVLDTETFAGLTKRARESLSVRTVNLIVGDTETSIMSGAMDSHPSMTLLRIPTPVDAQGYDEIADELVATQKRIEEIQIASVNRRAHSKESAIGVYTYLMAFPPRLDT
jgi:hypothetical protein